MRQLVLVLVSSLVILVAGGILLTLAGQRLIASRVTRELEGALAPPVIIGKLEIKPSELSILLAEISVGPWSAALGRIERARISVDPWQSVRAWRLVCNVWLQGVKLDLREGESLFRVDRGRGRLVSLGKLDIEFDELNFVTGAGQQLELVSGTVELNGQTGELRAKVETGLASFADLSVPLAFKATGLLGDNALRLELLKLSLPGLGLRLRGAIGLGSQRIEAGIQARGEIAKAKWLADLVPSQLRRGRMRIQGLLTGTLADPALRAEGVLNHVRVGQAWMKAARLSVGASRRGARLRLNNVDVKQGRAKASVSLVAGGRRSWRGRMSWRGLKLTLPGAGEQSPAIEVSGQLQAAGDLVPASMRMRGRISIGSTRQDIEYHVPVRFKALRDIRQAWRLCLASFKQGHGKARVDLRISREWELGGRVNLSLVGISGLAKLAGLDAAGDARLRGRVHGSVDDPVLEARVSAASLRVAGLPLEELAGAVVLRRGVIETRGVTALVAGGHLTMTGRVGVKDGEDNNWRLSVGDLSLADAMAALLRQRRKESAQGAVLGALTGEVTGRGKWPEVAFQAGGVLRGLQVWGEKVGEAEISAAGVPSNWSAQGWLGDVDRKMLRATVRVKDGDLGCEITASEPALGRIRVEANLDHGVITVGKAQLKSQGEKLTISGRVNLPGREMSWSASGAIGLVALETLPGVVSSRGTMMVNGKVSRDSYGHWQMAGGASIIGGALDLGFPVAISELNAAALLHGSVIELQPASAALGGGRLSVGGTADLDGAVNLSWSAKQVYPGVPAWLEARVSGSGQVIRRARAGEILIRGDIEVLEALYDRNLRITDLLPWLGKQPRVSSRARGRIGDKLGLDLHLVAHDSIYLDNNMANIELAADIRVLGTLAKPVLLGRIETLTGEIYLEDRTFAVLSGVVGFQDRERLNPRLELFAETDVSSADVDHHVWVHVSGTMDDNRVTFGADDPALTENDILGLLAFGRTAAELAQGGVSIPLSRLLALAPMPVGERIDKDLVKALPIDRLELDPALSRATGRLEPRITATKNFSHQLAAKMSTTVGSERARQVVLEYRITPELLLEGSWQGETKTRAGAFGADLKFRHRFMSFPHFWMGR